MNSRELGPEDFLAPGENNLLRGITAASQRLLGSNSYAVFDLAPEAVQRAVAADQSERIAAYFAEQALYLQEQAEHYQQTEPWVEALLQQPEA